MDIIYTGNDKAIELGYTSYREMIIRLAERNGKPWHGEFSDSSVYARIDFSRWIADCECGGASYVDMADDFFYCSSCGNQAHDGKARHVIFPNEGDRKKIEEELLKRKTKSRLGLFGTDAAMNATGIISRSWRPGESVETLKEQREQAEKIEKEREKVKDGIQ